MSVLNKNTINSTSMSLRDALLQKNLKPIYPQFLNQLPSPKIGEPVLDLSINADTNQIPFGLPLEEEGIFNMEIQTLENKFKNTDSTRNDLTNIENIARTKSTWTSIDYPIDMAYPRSSNEDVTKYGIKAKTDESKTREISTLKNLYLDTSKQIDMGDYVDLPNQVTKNNTNYLDWFNSLSSNSALDTVGSLLSGQGVGIGANGGLIDNFDIRTTLAGRVLGATGILNDTNLGIIGGQQLARSLANNTAFNIEQNLIGKLNIQENTLSLIKDGSLVGLRPNYQITVQESTLGSVLDTTSRILGFSIPRSYLSDSGSIFQSESGDVNDIDRINSMILNTGSGQVTALIANVNASLIGTSASGFDSPENSPFRSGYAAPYKNNKGEEAISGDYQYAYSLAGNLLESSDGIIPNISYQREKMTLDSGFGTPESNYLSPGYSESTIKQKGFTWGTTSLDLPNFVDGYSPMTGPKKSLLVKTQELFNSTGMMSIISREGDMNKIAEQIQTAVVGGGISKGNAVMQAHVYTQDGVWDGVKNRFAENTYCRSWTTSKRYDTVNKMVRSRGLYGEGELPYRFNTEGSVLDDNGFPKIAPYRTDKKEDPKKFMFSIENLAWNDRYVNLLPSEQGPGDLTTGKKGRIMWFPPYEINFTENNTVNLESTQFIGRGEPLYTYNNTERTGTLSFKVIVDHASYINSFSSSNGSVVDDHYVASYIAGCVEPSGYFGDKLTSSDIQSIEHEYLPTPQKKVVNSENAPEPFAVYFPNDNANLVDTYENGLSGSTSADKIDYTVYQSGYGIGAYRSNFTPGITESWYDGYNFGLNAGVTENGGDVITLEGVQYDGWLDPNLFPALNTYLLTKCPHCVVTVSGYASKQGSTQYNENLAVARANYIITILKGVLFTGMTQEEKNKRFKVGKTGEITSSKCIKNDTITTDPITGQKITVPPRTDAISCKRDRKAVVSFKFDASLVTPDILPPSPSYQSVNKTINSKIKNRFYNEQIYFDKLKREDNFVFDKFRERIKYFHPAFHSTTPEGLNSRLTFLLQCTRQGPTLEDSGANNLAFGRAPVCILRIGDFYNTKIMMDSVNIDYDPLVWDLNPEGIGVQPMIANVNISFKFIGGSSLRGPISKLQNALSFNYFANTQVYDPRADYISRNRPTEVKSIDPVTKLPVIGPVTETESGYYLNNGFSGNMNENSEFNNTTTTVTTQVEADILILPSGTETVITPETISVSSVFTAPKLTGLSVSESNIVKDNSNWNIAVKLLTDVTNSSENDSDYLSSDGNVYSFKITSIDGSNVFQKKITKADILSGLNKLSSESNFSVPFTSNKAGNVVLSLLSNNKVINKINVKLT